MKKILLILISFILLNACTKNTIEVDLTPEQQQQYEEKLQMWSEKLTNFVPEEDAEDKRPSMDYFIEKARYEEYLGRLGDATKTLKKGMELYPISSVGWNNLAKIYEKQGKYKKALEMYEKILSNFPILQQYHVDIIKMNIILKNKEEALKVYNAYKEKTGFQDPNLYKKIRALE